MKKVALILGVLFGFIFLTGCTDQSTEFEERIELENEQLIDKGGSINPGGSGQGQDDTNEEE